MLALIRTLPVLAQLAVGAVTLLSIGGGLWAVHHHIWQQGWDAREAEIQKQNKEVRDDADEVRDRVRMCRLSGGVWSQAAGKCVGP